MLGLSQMNQISGYDCPTSSRCTTDLSLITLEVVVHLLSCVQLFVTPGTAERQAPLSFTVSWSLLRFMSVESGIPSNHLILCCPRLLLSSIFPSIREMSQLFSSESALCIRWPKYRSFSISPSKEYSRLISFKVDWFDLLAVQWGLKSLLQHYSLKASILQCSAFFIFQLTSIHDNRKNHRFDLINLYWQRNVLAF